MAGYFRFSWSRSALTPEAQGIGEIGWDLAQGLFELLQGAGAFQRWCVSHGSDTETFGHHPRAGEVIPIADDHHRTLWREGEAVSDVF